MNADSLARRRKIDLLADKPLPYDKLFDGDRYTVKRFRSRIVDRDMIHVETLLHLSRPQETPA